MNIAHFRVYILVMLTERLHAMGLKLRRFSHCMRDANLQQCVHEVSQTLLGPQLRTE